MRDLTPGTHRPPQPDPNHRPSQAPQHPGSRPPPPRQRVSAYRATDLTSGQPPLDPAHITLYRDQQRLRALTTALPAQLGQEITGRAHIVNTYRQGAAAHDHTTPPATHPGSSASTTPVTTETVAIFNDAQHHASNAAAPGALARQTGSANTSARSSHPRPDHIRQPGGWRGPCQSRRRGAGGAAGKPIRIRFERGGSNRRILVFRVAPGRDGLRRVSPSPPDQPKPRVRHAH